MAIVRNYADPRAIPSAGAVGSSAAMPLAMVAPDVAGLQFNYSDNKALEGGINSAFRDLLGREATPEEIAKYSANTGSDKQIFYNGLVDSIVNDNFDQMSDDTVIKYLAPDNSGTEAEQAMFAPDRGRVIYNSAMNANSALGDNGSYRPEEYKSVAAKELAKRYTDSRTGYNGGEAAHAAIEVVDFRNQDVAQFLTKMDAKQTSALFQDAGIEESQANNLANHIASQDWNGVKEGDIQARLGMNDAQLNTLGRAMFSDRDVSFGNNTNGQRHADIGKQNNGERYAASSNADNNNVDYKQFTVYDPKKGLHFTGGYVPEKPQADWMGKIVLGAILGVVGVAAGVVIGAGASAAGAGGTAATVGAGGVVAGTGTAGTIGAIGGGAVAGGASAAIQGAPIGKGMLTGAVSAGLGQLGTPAMTGSRMVDGAITGAARGAITSKIAGGDATVGALSGATSSVISPIVQRYVPGVAGNLVSGYVNSAVKASLIDTPTRTRAPAAASQVQQTSTGMISALPTLTTNRRVVRG